MFEILQVLVYIMGGRKGSEITCFTDLDHAAVSDLLKQSKETSLVISQARIFVAISYVVYAYGFARQGCAN